MPDRPVTLDVIRYVGGRTIVNCRKVNQLLSAYMDSELPGIEHRQVRSHLAACSPCRDEYEALLQTKRLLASLQILAPRPAFAAELSQNIARHGENSMSFRSMRRALGSPWWTAFSHPGVPVRLAGVGLGLAAIALLLTTRPVYHEVPTDSQIVFTTNDSHSLPPAPAYTASPSRYTMGLGLVGYSPYAGHVRTETTEPFLPFSVDSEIARYHQQRLIESLIAHQHTTSP